MITKADEDNDGVVSEEEFYNIMTRKTTKTWLGLLRYLKCNKINSIIPEKCKKNLLISSKKHLKLTFLNKDILYM